MLIIWEAPDPLNTYKFMISIATLSVGVIGGLIALATFRRTEKWKKAEFIAEEMKEFFADENVKKTLLMIDWGKRRIKLLPETATHDGTVVVDRLLQARALRPHIVETEFIPDHPTIPKLDKAKTDSSDLASFYPAEVAIRDCYDGFLDGLSKFASYVKTDLVEVEVLSTYLRYWIKCILESTEDPDDAAWKTSLLTYISYYEYTRVIWLFGRFGYDINPSDGKLKEFSNQMQDKRLASALMAALN
jgi:hypothetical protein